MWKAAARAMWRVAGRVRQRAVVVKARRKAVAAVAAMAAVRAERAAQGKG